MKRDHAKLICDVSELTALFHDAPAVEDFLTKITDMVTVHMSCEVCSIYLYYQDSGELILKATKGLNQSSINNVHMKIGEGLTGLSLKEKRPICEGQAKNNPNFRFFPGIGEERFESFLAVPILRGSVEIGVMVVQSERKNYFTSDDIQIFRAITSQLATVIETARLLMTLNDLNQPTKVIKPKSDLKFIKGKIGSEGVVYAGVVILGSELTDIGRMVKPEQSHLGEADFYKAVTTTQQQLEDLQKQIETSLFDVAGMIFTAQALMLKDKGFNDAIVQLIRSGQGAPQAVAAVVDDYVAKFSRIADSYLRDKIYDVKDVGRRLLENLTGEVHHHMDYAGKIVIAQELLPSDALKLFSLKVGGIILLSGGATGHVAILSRSLNIPLVIADEPALLQLTDDTPVLLDAAMGYIHVTPEDDVKNKVLARQELDANIATLKSYIKDNPTTADGVPVRLMANINLLGDLKAANEFKADGVGLYRTEFPFLIRSDFPSQEEQYLIYRKLIEGMPGKSITIRTLDIGGDKVLAYFDYAKEDNPFLGLRSIRFSLRHADVFAVQIKAVLRAAAGYDVRLLFPMISSMDEFLQAKNIVQVCADELKREGEEFNEHVPLGVMVELPSIVEIIDDIAQEADFFSIGTNDLVQYTIGVDRTNDKVSDMYLPYHPSVVRSLKRVAVAAHKYGKEVSVCGDMAHESKYMPLLLGLGLTHLSMDARYLPKANEHVARLNYAQCQRLADDILKKSQIAQIAQILEQC